MVRWRCSHHNLIQGQLEVWPPQSITFLFCIVFSTWVERVHSDSAHFLTAKQGYVREKHKVLLPTNPTSWLETVESSRTIGFKPIKGQKYPKRERRTIGNAVRVGHESQFSNLVFLFYFLFYISLTVCLLLLPSSPHLTLPLSSTCSRPLSHFQLL